MTDVYLPLFGAFAAGLGLGLIYFGGLWLTVRKLPAARQPGLLAAGSLAGRMAVCLFGFYLVMDGRWERLLSCLAGFVLIRISLVRRLPGQKPAPAIKKEGRSR